MFFKLSHVPQSMQKKMLTFSVAITIFFASSSAMEPASVKDKSSLIPKLVKLCQKALPNQLAKMALDPKIKERKEHIAALRIPKNLQVLLCGVTQSYTAKSQIECIDIHLQEPLLAYVESAREGYPYILKFANISDPSNITWLSTEERLSGKPTVISWAPRGRHISVLSMEQNECLIVNLDKKWNSNNYSGYIEYIIPTRANNITWAPSGNTFAISFEQKESNLTIFRCEEEKNLIIQGYGDAKQVLWDDTDNKLYTINDDQKLLDFDLENGTFAASELTHFGISRQHNGKIAKIIKMSQERAMMGFEGETYPLFLDTPISCLACNPRRFKPAWIDKEQNIAIISNHSKYSSMIKTVHTSHNSVPQRIDQLSWSPNGLALVAVNEHGKVHYNEIVSGILFTPSENANNKNCVAWHPQDTHLFMAAKDNLHIFPLYRSVKAEEETLTLAQAALICSATQEKEPIILCEHNQEPQHLWEIYTQPEWPPKIKKYLDSYMKKECKVCTPANGQ